MEKRPRRAAFFPGQRLGERKQQEAAYVEQVRQRLEKQLHCRAKELGFTLTKVAAEPAATTE